MTLPQRLGRMGAGLFGSWRDGIMEWLDHRLREMAEHPVRLVWTLLVTAALFSAVWPLIHDSHGFWVFASNWGLFKNAQNDYGEGPMFNQQLIFYHLIFDRGNPLYKGLTPYQLAEKPPFIVGNYPPVFPLMGAVFMKIFGTTFTAGRMVSTLSIFGASILVGLIVWQGTGQILPGIFAGGVLITMPLGIGTWGPFNRVDSLSLFWSMLTVFLVLRYAGTGKIWWAIPFAVLTIYTRQDVVDGIFASFCYLVVKDWRRAIWVAVITTAAIMGIFVVLQIWTHGAFYLNTVTDNNNSLNWGVTMGDWASYIHGEGQFIFPLAVAGAAAGLFGTGSVMWAVWLVASVFIFATIGKVGAASNYYFTLEAASAACAGLFVGRLRTFFRRAPFPLWPLELVMPAAVFVFVHGAAPGWVPPSLPLLQKVESLVGTYKIPTGSGTAQQASQNVAGRSISGEPTGIIDYLETIQGPVLGINFPCGFVPQSGHIMQFQPFEFGVEYADGTWQPTPFIDAINDRYYAAVVYQGGYPSPGGYIGAPARNQITQAILANYHRGPSYDGYGVMLANGPVIGTPPTVPEYVPHPLPALGHFLAHHLEHLPQTVWHVLREHLVPVHMAQVGPFDEVNILPLLNLIGVENPGVPASNPTGYDGGGNFLSTVNDFPAAGTTFYDAFGQHVPFYIPPAGSQTNSILELVGPETVHLPPARDSAIWLLESAVDLTQVTTVTLNYSTGISFPELTSFSDWCAATHQPNEAVAFRGTGRLNAQGQAEGPPCGMYVMRIATDPTRELVSVQFGPNPRIQIGAVTIQKVQ